MATFEIRVFGLDVGPSALVPPQPGGWAHLVTLRRGAARLRTARAHAFLTAESAAWIPACEPYALDLRSHCELRILYVAESFFRARPLGPVVLNPLLRELVERAMTAGYLDPFCERDARLLAVIQDEISILRAGPAPAALPLPRDLVLANAVRRALASENGVSSVRALAFAAGMSVRTFERRFTRETGLAPARWLRRARLGSASLVLAAGASVTEAGFACGYESLSAFIAAYRSEYGVTPGHASAVSSRSLATRA